MARLSGETRAARRGSARTRSTLSADTKDTLASDVPAESALRSALLAALARYAGAARKGTFRTQRFAIARLAHALRQSEANAPGAPIRKIANARLTGAPHYDVDLDERVLAAAGSAERPRTRAERRVEMRAAFLACGSLAMPARGYHLELLPPDAAASERLRALFRAEDIALHRSVRSSKNVLYLKDGDAIARALAAIGASAAVFALEDARALKETKNRIHRLVNTEAANVDRATSAAAAQCEAIAALLDAHGATTLSPPLREAATLRLAHPDETLAELGRRCEPPVGKSTFGGRIAALVRRSANGRSRKPG